MEITSSVSKQNNSIKNQYYYAIKDRNHAVLDQLTNGNLVDPHEEISIPGYFWTPIHYACHFKNKEALEYLIRLAYLKYPEQFINIMNLKTSLGQTPLMVCCTYDSQEQLKVLLKYGGIQLKAVNNENQTAVELSQMYANSCHVTVTKAIAENDNMDLLPINVEALNQLCNISAAPQDSTNEEPRDLNDVEIAQYKELLLKGELLPCSICYSNLGFLEYTQCCGLPYHSHCFKGQNKDPGKQCEFCYKSPCKLTNKINNPKNAFVLEQ